MQSVLIDETLRLIKDVVESLVPLLSDANLLVLTLAAPVANHLHHRGLALCDGAHTLVIVVETNLLVRACLPAEV